MITEDDLNKLEILRDRISKLQDWDDGYNLGDDVTWLINKLTQAQQENNYLNRLVGLYRATLKEAL